MNYKQIYKTRFEEVFNVECHDIERAVAYIANNQQSNEFRTARKALTSPEKNEIITRIYINYEFEKHA